MSCVSYHTAVVKSVKKEAVHHCFVLCAELDASSPLVVLKIGPNVPFFVGDGVGGGMGNGVVM